MIDWIIQNIWAFILPVEIGLLFFFYKFYFSEYNARRWKEKAEEDGFLTDILSPVIDAVVSDTTDAVLEKMKYEMLSAQGTMTKQIMASENIENPEDMMVHLSNSLLQSIGYRKPHPIITMKLAQGIGSVANKVLQNQQTDETTESIKTGHELLNSL